MRPHVRSVLGKTFMDKMSSFGCKVTTQWYFPSKIDVPQYQISLQSRRVQKKKKTCTIKRKFELFLRIASFLGKEV